jgi:hypothetical protein
VEGGVQLIVAPANGNSVSEASENKDLAPASLTAGKNKRSKQKQWNVFVLIA